MRFAGERQDGVRHVLGMLGDTPWVAIDVGAAAGRRRPGSG